MQVVERCSLLSVVCCLSLAIRGLSFVVCRRLHFFLRFVVDVGRSMLLVVVYCLLFVVWCSPLCGACTSVVCRCCTSFIARCLSSLFVFVVCCWLVLVLFVRCPVFASSCVCLFSDVLLFVCW